MDWSELFHYDETSPSCLRWRVGRYRGRNGCTQFIWPDDEAGSVDDRGYYVIHMKGIGCIFAHRIVWELHNGQIPADYEIDHNNGIRNDNRVCNLTKVTSAQNSRNRELRSDNTVGVSGVVRREFKPKTSNSNTTVYYIFQGNTLEGRRISKTFSVNKYGEEKAFLMACIYRDFILFELNDSGAGYTLRHLGAGI